jgi:hypothetical protein
VTGKTILAEGFDKGIGFLGWVKGCQGGDAAGTGGILDGIYAKASCQVGLDTECVADDRNGTGIGTLDTGRGALYVVAVTFGRAAVTIVASAGGLNDREVRGVAAAAHGTVGQVGVQGKRLAAMTKNAAKGLYRMGIAYLGEAKVTGETVLHLTGESGGQSHRLGAEAWVPCSQSQYKQEYE